MAIEFTVDHDHTYASEVGFEQLIGWITFSVGTAPGDFRYRDPSAGLAQSIKLPPRRGWLAADGHLYRDQTLAEPCRLVANDPLFNLQHLTYRADFALTTLAGDPVSVPHTYFPAPSSDTLLQLTKVMTDPYQPVMEVRAKVYTEDILDAGEFGTDLLFTGTTEDFWELAGTVPSTNLPSYVDDVLEFNNYAAFPATGETGKIYVDKDTGDSYRWTGTAYFRISLASAADGSGLVSLADGQVAGITGGKLVNQNPVVIDPTAAPYSVKMDRYTSTQASMSSTSNPTHLTVTGYTFTSADVGKVVKVVGAAAAGANLKTTITGATAGKAILASPCLTTVAGAFAMFGTDNRVALQALFDDLSSTSRTRELARTAVFPMGAALFSGTLYLPQRGTVKGTAENWSNFDIMYSRFGGAENTGGTVFYQIWDQNVDLMRVQHTGYLWTGKLEGFAVVQDWENTAGNGIRMIASDGTGVKLNDGGVIQNVAAFGCAAAGFDFAGGALSATVRDLWAFCNGYQTRKLFTANTTSGSAVLSSVSSMSGLAVGDILSGSGLQPDSVITAVDSGASTVTMSRAAAATATGVSVQRAGSPGIRFKMWVSDPIHFDHPAGDQNSGGLLRIVGGAPAVGLNANSQITITNLKSEYAENVYWNGYAGPGTGLRPVDVPQQQNAVVLTDCPDAKVSIRGLVHWGSTTSGVDAYDPPNTFGREIGAAVLNLPQSAAPIVTWEAATIHLPANSTQSTFIFRDSFTGQAVADDGTGRGTNRPVPRAVRSVADTNTTIDPLDSIVVWSSLTANRVATLPALSAVAVGRTFTIADGSGSASPSVPIGVVAAGSDTIIGGPNIRTPYGQVSFTATASGWIASNPVATNADGYAIIPQRIVDNNNRTLLEFLRVANAVNRLAITNAAAGNGVGVYAYGDDSNIPILFAAKGTSPYQFFADTGTTYARLQIISPEATKGLNIETKGGAPVTINNANTVETQNNRGVANGYVPLNSSSKIDASYLPASAMEWQGVWDASTNTPTLIDGTGNAGDVYRVSVGGTRDLGSGSVTYGVGDLLIYDGAVWQRSDSTDSVASVNGYTGSVTLAKSDVGLGNVDNTSDANKPISTATQTALDAKVTSGGALGTPASGNLTNCNVEGADLADAYDTEKQHAMTSGESTISRRMATSNAQSATGSQRFTYFTARKTETITSIRTLCVTAATSATLCRIGVYSVAGNGDLTLIASTANDTALWSVNSTSYTKSLSASWSKVRGQRYAISVLYVGSGTGPTLSAVSAVNGDEAAQAPRLSGAIFSQADLASSVSAGSLFNTGVFWYAAMVP